MKNLRLCLLAATILVCGCAPLTVPTRASATQSAVPHKTGTIRVGFSSNADLGDVPSLMAHELLRAEGYTIQARNFAGADLQVSALMQGDLDIANGSMRTVWIAQNRKPAASTIMEQVKNNWLLVSKTAFKTCAELEGQRIAFTNTGSLNYALFVAHTKKHCPELKYEQLFISSSGNRAAALLAGELEATPLSLSDWIQVQQKEPNRFHVLVNYAAELPELKTTGVHANRAFAEQQPEAVRDYIRALLTVHRTIQSDPTALEKAIVKFLDLDAETAQTLAQAYLALGMWDPNGGLEREDVQSSLDFFTENGSLPEGLTVDGVADLSYLNQVLEEIGRR